MTTLDPDVTPQARPGACRKAQVGTFPVQSESGEKGGHGHAGAIDGVEHLLPGVAGRAIGLS